MVFAEIYNRYWDKLLAIAYKGLNLSQKDKIMFRKRAIIECINDELKTTVNYSISDIDP